jgi:hypothetical protein
VAGCASQDQAVVVAPPEVSVSRLASTVITPDLVKFEAKVVIRNRSTSTLELDRLDYAVDLMDRELFTDSFSELLRTRGRGSQTVTLPFQIAMKDILDQSIPILAEGQVRVAFRGTVYPLAFEPAPFSDEISLPLPRIPEVGLSGVDGTPVSDLFRVRLRVRNTNSFPVTVANVETHMDINQQRYRMLHTQDSTEIQPGGTGTVLLQMENRPGRTLSMALSALSQETLKLAVGGTIECRSPYGWIVIPFEARN